MTLPFTALASMTLSMSPSASEAPAKTLILLTLISSSVSMELASTSKGESLIPETVIVTVAGSLTEPSLSTAL